MTAWLDLTAKLSTSFSAALERAVRRLRPAYRRCFVLRYVEERSYAEIARIMNLPVSTVGTNLQRAREELKGMLEPLHPSPTPRRGKTMLHPTPPHPTM